MTALIETQNLTFHYQNTEKNLLEAVTISFEEGTFTALLGSNGSGKSTLLKQFNGLLTPNEGAVFVLGNKTSEHENWLTIRQNVGLVFQNPENQIVSTIVEEDVAFALENLGVKRETIRQRVNEALQMVDMYDYRLHPPYKLSGGQKQRVAIASILAMRPRCILFDEATSMLDPQGRAEILAIIRRLNKEYGVTIIMITHLMEEVIDADRILILDKGTVVYDDSPYTVFQHVAAIEKLGLTVPVVTKLADRLKQKGIHLSEQTLLTKEDFAEAIKQYMEGHHGTIEN